MKDRSFFSTGLTLLHAVSIVLPQAAVSGQECHIQDNDISSSYVPRESLISVLGVVYVHRKTSDGGDIYLTLFGLPLAQHLQIENWYEKEWFQAHREQLHGTGSVYRIPTKAVDGDSIELVIKNCRVGEHVPLDTHTFLEYINTEFNSPWEEFSLVMELREGRFGPSHLKIQTQEPLAIYVPPDRMQLWQSGRSRDKIERINARHPGIDLDILRQYKMIYGWIRGTNAVEISSQIGMSQESQEALLKNLTLKATSDLETKGFIVADMKPAHIILDENHTQHIASIGIHDGVQLQDKQIEYLQGLLEKGQYSVVDYELLLRTPPNEEQVKYSRRHSYLDDQRDRFVPTPLPSHLRAVEILGVPYIHGRVESTGGQLWVVGRNGRLFDYFLPERWRKTIHWRLSENNEEYYTVTKDNVHIIWKTSRVGERPQHGFTDQQRQKAVEVGFNSPFEEFAIAQFLSDHGIPTVYMRAVYSTGIQKIETSQDLRRYETHQQIVDTDGVPVLIQNHNLISIRGYYNGPDVWVAQQKGQLCRRIDLGNALSNKLITQKEYQHLFSMLQQKLIYIGFDGSLLMGNDLLLTLDPAGDLIKDKEGWPEVRICNFELLFRC